MVPSPPNGRLSETTIRLQHQKLKALMEAIANRFRSEQKPTRDLVSLLNALSAHLQMHFEFEETDGYFSGLAEKTPRVSSAVERLLREHELMLEEVDDLIAFARETFESAGDNCALAKRFSQFHTRLDDHEQEESDLIRDVYNVDVAGEE